MSDLTGRNLVESRSNNAYDYGFGVLDKNTDLQWANAYRTTGALHNYFDYYFSGQDIQVYIDGVPDSDPDAQLPIYSLGFQVEQQKTPIYGFWDYTFSQVMRGTRIISGVFTLFTTSTDYMTRVLSKAATARVNGNRESSIRGLDRDESLIEQYWSRNINDDTMFSSTGKNLFSSHPPFNLIIVYGIQTASISSENKGQMYSDALAEYKNDTPLYTDVNERLVPTDSTNAMRIILNNCEIVKFSTEYSPDGQPIAEQYQFFARDIDTPKTGRTYNRRTTNSPAIG